VISSDDDADASIGQPTNVVAFPGLRVVVVEDVEVLRRGLHEMVQELPMVKRVSSFSSVDEALPVIRSEHAQILIVNADIPETSIRSLGDASDAALVLLLRTVNERVVRAAAELPVSGFLVEDDLNSDGLARVLANVLAGEAVMPRAVADQLFRSARSGHVKRDYGLTPRERKVLALLVEGMSNKEIAKRLGIKTFSAKRHVASILAKLNCENRTLAVVRALSEGLVEPGNRA
jgi:DNA-binding NarL/FixJ family response regulator